jgi:hypothetical protein
MCTHCSQTSGLKISTEIHHLHSKKYYATLTLNQCCSIYNQFMDAIWVVGVVCKICLTAAWKMLTKFTVEQIYLSEYTLMFCIA